MYDNGWGRTRRRDDAVIFSHSRVKKSVNTKMWELGIKTRHTQSLVVIRLESTRHCWLRATKR